MPEVWVQTGNPQWFLCRGSAEHVFYDGLEEIPRKYLTDPKAFDEFHRRKQALLDSLAESTDDSVDMYLVRDFAEFLFNSEACGLVKPVNALLGAIAYSPVNEHPSLASRISTSMENLPWFDVYGLSYTDVLALPFDRWWEMSDRLKAYAEKNGASANEQQVTVLRELGEKLDLIVDTLSLLVKISLPPKKTGKNRGRRQKGL